MAAQKIETELLQQQCGIQDQIASAYGGINYIEMYEYPHATVSQIRVPDAVWWELESRLALIFLQRIIDIAREHGACGWKVNGAGGAGGSVPLLCGPDRAAQRALLREIEATEPKYRNIPIYLSRLGLRVWEPAGARTGQG